MNADLLLIGAGLEKRAHWMVSLPKAGVTRGSTGRQQNPKLTEIQSHTGLVLPPLTNGNVQWRVASQTIPNIGVAAVVIKDVLKDIGRTVHDPAQSARIT